MKFVKCLFFCALLLSSGLTAAQHYGGNEVAKVLAEFTKKWNIGVMGTGESHPNEHLDYLHLVFNSNEMLSPNEARNLLMVFEKELLVKLNKCPKLKKRLKYKYFQFENLTLSIAFTDKKHQRYPGYYAADAFLSPKGICIFAENEWEQSDVVLREEIPPEYLEEVQRLCQPFQVQQR